MTSKISFFKLTINEWKKLGWLTALQALLFAMVIPLRLLLPLALEKKVRVRSLTDVLYENVGFDKTLTTVTIVAMGILCALAVFSYLHSRKRLDFYYSLAIRRDTLFLVKYTAGTLTFVIPFLANQALAVLVGALYGVMSAAVVQEMASASLLGILFFLTSYSAAAVAVLLTGKTLTSVLAIGTLSVYLPLVWLVVCGCQEIFLPTLLPDGVSYLGGAYRLYLTSRRLMLEHSSPWIMILAWNPDGAAVRQGLTGIWPDLGSICLFLVLPAAMTALCLALCRVRRTEAAGKALAFAWTEGLIKIMLAVPAALFIGMTVYEELDSVVWEICFVAAFGALGCVIMEFIYRWDIRQALAHKWHIAVTLALSLAIFLIFRLDLAGINTYLPEKEELAAMSVRRSYSDFCYYNDDGKRTKNEQDILRLLETDKVDLLYPLAENGVRNVQKDAFDGQYVSLNMEYRLKSGRTVFRSYTVDYDLYESAARELMQDEEYRRRYYPILSWDDERLKQIEDIWVLLPQEQWEKFEEDEAQEKSAGAGKAAGNEEFTAGGVKNDTAAAIDSLDGKSGSTAAREKMVDGLVTEITTAADNPDISGELTAGAANSSDVSDELSVDTADNPDISDESAEGLEADTSLYPESSETEEFPEDEWEYAEYSSMGVMTGMTLTEEAGRRLIRAYQEDLAESDGLLTDAGSEGSMSIEWRREQNDPYNVDRYLLRKDFTRTMEVLREAYLESALREKDMRG